MIEWKKFDISNPPPLYKIYLVYTRTHIKTAWIDKHPYSERIIWFNDNHENIVEDVTHYAEINVPV